MSEIFREIVLSNDGSRLYAASGKQLTVYDISDGGKQIKAIPTPTATIPAEKQEHLSKTKTTEAEITHLRYLRLTPDGNYLIGTVDDSKAVMVLDSSSLEVVNEMIFPKRPCCLDLADNSGTLVVGDKFGDVYTVPLLEKGFAIGNPVLGHVSMLVDVKVAHSGTQQVIITADRDEHIRITKYPQSYIIDRWLFGHTEFVSTLRLVDKQDNLLLSGGGDDFIALWDWTTGELKSKLDLKQHIEKHVDADSVRNDGSVEVNVKKILRIGSSYVVLNEGLKVLVIFTITDDELIYEKSIVLDSTPTDISVSGGTIAVSLLSTNSRVKFYDETGSLVQPEAAKGIQGTGEEFNSSDNSFYTLKPLRKRNEF